MVARGSAEGPAVGKEPSPKPVAAGSHFLFSVSLAGRAQTAGWGWLTKSRGGWGHLNMLGVRSEAAPLLSSGCWAGNRSRRLWLPPLLSTGLLSMVVLGSELVGLASLGAEFTWRL